MYTFLDDKILDENGLEIMMDWETDLMQEHAKIVTENGGDILEIGFGMGICSNFIQQANINTHTIIEIHDQIFEKLLNWAKDKPNVIPIKGDWFDSIPNKKYDGIMFDTWKEKNAHHFLPNIKSSLNKKGIVTWFNSSNKDVVEHNCNNLKWGTLTIKEINVNPPKDTQYKYFNQKTYYIPKLVL
jgi:tRNA A58 N-methylase Trm61|tara:strand:- start:542 stop:1096 length:555 start_codon:yes stop_codon:yes gene_type:complete